MQFLQYIVMSVLLYSGFTWAVVKQHISPLAVFQLNCLRRICGVYDPAPNVAILDRCNTLSAGSQRQKPRWLGHVFRMPKDRLPENLLFREVKGLCPPGRLRAGFNMLRYMIGQTVGSVGLIGMHKIGCSGETRLVQHAPSSS